MILTAAMAIPGNGPEMVSGELIEQGLDLSGKWEGTWQGEDSFIFPLVRVAKTGVRFGEGPSFLDWEIRDEGQGKLSIRTICGTSFGIYEQDGDRLMICTDSRKRPTTYRGGDGQSLLILHRVKSRK
ncbi:MAG TPA: hypothetical protein VMG10_09550 [Gemmataceae bacterium]|nr:hypothetical protein [Gemmataceae bacterium]